MGENEVWTKRLTKKECKKLSEKKREVPFWFVAVAVEFSFFILAIRIF